MAFEILSNADMPTEGEAYDRFRNGDPLGTIPDGRFGNNLKEYIFEGQEL